MFRIIDIETGEPVRSMATDLPVEFIEGAVAQQIAKRKAAETGRKYRVKRVLNNEWHSREQIKFTTGVYEYLPWVYDDWWNDPKRCVEIHKYQFPHPSKKEPGKIAFIESAEKGMDNIHTRVKVGRYLEQFSIALDYHGVDRQGLIKNFENNYAPKTLRFAKTEDEIQWVYENGPGSCMSDSNYRHRHGWGFPNPGEWPDNYHACRVYAYGDLQVAYILADDSSPRARKNVLSRAVVWPERKTFSRCYGDERKLKLALQSEGYVFAAPVGAKLIRKPFDNRFIVPYIDAGDRSGAGSLYVLDRKDYMEITDNARLGGCYRANNVSGLSGGRMDRHGNEAECYLCAQCGEDDVETVRVFTSGTSFQNWCQECVDNHDTFYCEREGRYWNSDFMDSVEMYDGSRWSSRMFNAHGAYCEGTQRRYPRRDIVTLHTGQRWGHDYYAEHGVRCEYTGRYHRREDCTRLANGMWYGPEAVEAFTFQCDSCQGLFPVHDTRRTGSTCFNCQDRQARDRGESLPEEQSVPITPAAEALRAERERARLMMHNYSANDVAMAMQARNYHNYTVAPGHPTPMEALEQFITQTALQQPVAEGQPYPVRPAPNFHWNPVAGEVPTDNMVTMQTAPAPNTENEG